MRTDSHANALVAASPVELARIVWTGWPVVLAAVMTTVLLTAAYIFYVAEKKYTAIGTIMIEPPASLYPSTPGVAEPGLDKSAIISQGEALRSRDLLRAVGTSLESEGLLSKGAAKPVDEAVEHLESALKISVVDESHVISAQLTDARPEYAGRALTLLFDKYIEREVSRRSSVNAAAREQYDSRAAALTTELDALNQQIAAQTAQTGRYFEGGTTVLFASMQTSVNQLDQLTAQLADVNAKIKVVTDAVFSGNAAIAAGIIDTPTIKRIAQSQVELELAARELATKKKGPQHPEVIAIRTQRESLGNLMKDEMRKGLQELDESRSHLMEQSRELRGRIGVLQAGSDRESQGTATLVQMEKKAEALRDMLNQVTGRLYDTAVAPNANAWVLAAPAVLPLPTSPKVGLSFLGATILGLVGGALVAFWREGKRRAARGVLGIYPVETMPALWSLSPPRQRLLGSRARGSFASAQIAGWRETLRAIGHRLALKLGNGAGISVAVVSAQPREGKTLVAVTLSRTLANDGYKVLLVDADLRKPDIHRATHASLGGPLHHVVGSNAGWRSLVQTDASSPLHLIAPTEPSDPSTGFLRDARIRDFLDAARQHYDFVIFDTSPVLRVADGLFFLDFVDSAILVSGERTDPRETQRVLAQPDFPLPKLEGVIRFGHGTGTLSYPGY